MIVIDGSAGEGGGQVLRTALALSLVTGQPFHMRNIRGRRKRPGLRRQHLTAVQAAADIGQAEVADVGVGSLELLFRPGTLRAGNYHYAIGTAGSCTLVLQAVLPALLIADGPSELVLEGGTHNPMAPPYDFLAEAFLPQLVKMGAQVTVELVRPGFYPNGGGKIRIKVAPVEKLKALELSKRCDVELTARALCAELPGHICQRELTVCQSRLELPEDSCHIQMYDQYGPGNVLTISARSEQLTETFSGFGEKGLPAEKVAGRLVSQVEHYLASAAPVGPYLADQLILPLAMAGRGSFVTTKPTQHTLTNIEIVKYFIDCKITVKQLTALAWKIEVESRAF